jgi:peptide/nickel transport system substrate-binding protein
VPGGALAPQALADIPVVKLAPGGIPGGTGPYRVTTFTAGESAMLVAVEGRGARPTLARVTVRRFRNPDDVLNELLGAKAPLVVAPPPETLGLARSHASYRVVTQPGITVIALAMDLGREPTPGVGLPRNPFRRPEVRRALRMALDRDALRKEGGGGAASQMAPPSAFGFDPQLLNPAPRVEEARSLLRAAGLARGFEVRMDLPQGYQALGRALLSQLERVGIRVQLNPLDGDRLADVMQYESSLALYAWTPESDTASALRTGMHGRAPERGFGRENWTGYADAEVDRAIERALAASDPAARRGALQAALRRLAEDSAWVPLLVPTASFVLPRGLTFPARPDGRISLWKARLEPLPTPMPLGTRRRQASR